MIDALREAYSVSELCRVFDVNRTSFHGWSKLSQAVKPEEVVLKAEILAIDHQMDGTYGSRRMSDELRARGHDIGRHAARTLMKECNIVVKLDRKHRYPNGGKPDHIGENLLNREFEVSEPNTVWAGDVTYIWTSQGWLYLAVVMDLFSRKIIGWATSNSPDTTLTLRALRLAVRDREITPRLIFHSDQGCHYTSKEFRSALEFHGIRQSMSRRGNCLDNAVVERFFRSLKTERVRRTFYASHAIAMDDIGNYIEVFYNRIRRHRANGNISPMAFEEKLLTAA